MIGIIFTNLANIGLAIDRKKFKVTKFFNEADEKKIEKALTKKTKKQRVLLVNGISNLKKVSNKVASNFKIVLRENPQIFLRNEIDIQDASVVETTGLWRADKTILCQEVLTNKLEKASNGYSLKYI